MAEIYYPIYKGWFCDVNDNRIDIELQQRTTIDPEVLAPIPETYDIMFAGHDDSPVVISVGKNDDRVKNIQINGSECTVNIMADDNFDLSRMYTEDEKEWKLVITGAISFQGYVLPDSCYEPYDSKPYPITISATDALGTLDELPFTFEDGTFIRGFLPYLTVLDLALQRTGLNLPYAIGVNTYPTGVNTATDKTQCPLTQVFIDTARFIDQDGNAFSCKEVIRNIMDTWSSRLHQWDGKWQMVNTLELSQGDVNAWLFDATLNANGSIQLADEITGGGLDRDIIPVGGYSLNKAFLNSTAYYQYGYPPNKLFNGNMDLWESKPDGLPDGWAVIQEDGLVNAYTGIRMVDGVETTDYYIVVEGQGSGRVGNTTGVSIRAGEKAIINFDLYAPQPKIGNDLRYLSVAINDENGNWYTSNGWQGTQAYYVLKYDLTDLQNQIKVSFEVLPKDVDYDLFFGVLPIGKVEGAVHYTTRINNVEIQEKVVSELTKIPIGEFNRQTSLSKQTFKPEPILLLHSDDTNDNRTSRISVVVADPVETPDFWERKGIDEASSLLHIVANTQLRLHSRPYRIFDANFHKYATVGVNTILDIDLLSGRYMFLSGDFDVATCIHKLRFAEILTDEVDYIEEQIQDYGTENEKNGIDIANPVGVSNIGTVQFNPADFAPAASQIPAASDSQTQGGSATGVYIDPLRLGNWLDYVRGMVLTISGAWDFTTRPTFNGANLITASDLPGNTGIVSSDATMNMLATNLHQVFNGTTATWTAPLIAGNVWQRIFVKNRGSDILTIVSNGGGNTFYFTSAVSSIQVNPGDAIILINDGTYWNIN